MYFFTAQLAQVTWPWVHVSCISSFWERGGSRQYQRRSIDCSTGTVRCSWYITTNSVPPQTGWSATLQTVSFFLVHEFGNCPKGSIWVTAWADCRGDKAENWFMCCIKRRSFAKGWIDNVPVTFEVFKRDVINVFYLLILRPFIHLDYAHLPTNCIFHFCLLCWGVLARLVSE